MLMKAERAGDAAKTCAPVCRAYLDPVIDHGGGPVAAAAFLGLACVVVSLEVAVSHVREPETHDRRKDGESWPTHQALVVVVVLA